MTWSVLPDIEHLVLQVSDVNIQGWAIGMCYSAYILVQLMCVTHAQGGAMLQAHVDVPNSS
jgi:hypothetical protein